MLFLLHPKPTFQVGTHYSIGTEVEVAPTKDQPADLSAPAL